ncbi:hypothetical protein A5320_08580 [Rheinheimera sp. SA_1]|uniref:HAD family hydrolase n=1 Tax=Rheinheimera sp. SA_1 TaxID=1827365 RepID=UPI0008015ECA|nr:HAD family hydrolase [Rheinheimera sp. SA_1]OBP15404.1 hypothetical protein A5320_08580 [Rheinheimera sp. SA_1]
MLNTLLTELNRKTISHIGFDLDGTLYDEADYVIQAYELISAYFAKQLNIDAAAVHQKLFQRWQEKGSSYPFIFSELLDQYTMGKEHIQTMVSEAVKIYRSTPAKLELPQSSIDMLDQLKPHFSLFLITDGQVATQNYKIKQLGLLRWFEPQNIVITGSIAPDAAKPSTKALTQLPELALVPASQVMYVGDRTVDQDFSTTAGFVFCQHRIVSKENHYAKT